MLTSLGTRRLRSCRTRFSWTDIGDCVRARFFPDQKALFGGIVWCCAEWVRFGAGSDFALKVPAVAKGVSSMQAMDSCVF
jgi:hypothetical protein